jgi:hypothetical protein
MEYYPFVWSAKLVLFIFFFLCHVKLATFSDLRMSDVF